METFMFAGKAGDWKTATYALDLSKIVPEAQSTTGPLLASLLYGVIHKAMWTDYLALSDRPDALDANASDKNPMAGEQRRSIRLAILDLSDRPVSIRLSRLKPATGDPIWVFSSQTVGNAVALYQIYGPTSFRALAAARPAEHGLLDAGLVGGLRPAGRHRGPRSLQAT